MQNCVNEEKKGKEQREIVVWVFNYAEYSNKL